MNIDEALATRSPKSGKTFEEVLKSQDLNIKELRSIADADVADVFHNAARILVANLDEVRARVHPRGGQEPLQGREQLPAASGESLFRGRNPRRNPPKHF